MNAHTDIAVNPTLSIVVIFHNMRREAPRTLHTMSEAYQRGVDGTEWEVLAVDNGSTEPLDPEMVLAFGRQFSYQRFETQSVSPVDAINDAATHARGTHIGVCIDGARMLSPGVIQHTLAGLRAYPRGVICTLSWHLGDKLQNLAVLDGYDQSREDELLSTVDWRHDGYQLFDIACLAASSKPGYGAAIAESNCIFLSRESFEDLGGFDTGFKTPGGGLANLDFMRRAVLAPGASNIHLLGEGSFHQFHGGVATNVAPNLHPAKQFDEEYRELRGEPFRKPDAPAVYIGALAENTRRFIAP
ncbi:MAG: glycosyltransferase [Lysobacterales bacterium]